MKKFVLLMLVCCVVLFAAVGTVMAREIRKDDEKPAAAGAQVYAPAVHELPEDEIGAYFFEDGVKYYSKFKDYQTCMNYMGKEEICTSSSYILNMK